ncbi:MAG TPA: molybdate ABC transporter permease subunit, partial [Luteimonas sp.]|nr:molybdate ABC transporter permease subunit [Luteimonas sp.]
MSTLALPSLTRPRWRRPLPGFGLSLGLAMSWLGVIVLLPLAALAFRAAGLGSDGWLRALQDPRVQAALKVSFGTAFVAALIALFAGALVAWVLVRYRFPGRRLLDALVDLPSRLACAWASPL